MDAHATGSGVPLIRRVADTLPCLESASASSQSDLSPVAGPAPHRERAERLARGSGHQSVWNPERSHMRVQNGQFRRKRV